MEIHAITVLVHVNVLQDIDHPRHTRTDRQTVGSKERKKERTWRVIRKHTGRQALAVVVVVGCDLTYWLTFPHLTTRYYWLAPRFSSLLFWKKKNSFSLSLSRLNQQYSPSSTHTDCTNKRNKWMSFFFASFSATGVTWRNVMSLCVVTALNKYINFTPCIKWTVLSETFLLSKSKTVHCPMRAPCHEINNN